MSYLANVFDVMIASPGDVQDERDTAREIVYEWNAAHSHTTKLILQPVTWETHSSPSMGDRPQAVLNKQVLNLSDLLVAIFWTRLGTPTGKAPSGTVEELDEHLKQGKPAMVYFSSAPVRPESVDSDQYKALTEFRRECGSRGLVQPYDSTADFRQKFARHLAATVNCHDYFRAARDSAPRVAANHDEHPAHLNLSKEATESLLEASKDPRGCIMRVRYLGGMNVSTNSRSFVEQASSRSWATWGGAVDELAGNGLIKDVGYKGEIYELTREGYDLAEILSRQT